MRGVQRDIYLNEVEGLIKQHSNYFTNYQILPEFQGDQTVVVVYQ